MQFLQKFNDEQQTIDLSGVGQAKEKAEKFFWSNNDACIYEMIEQVNGAYLFNVKNRSHKILFSIKQVL